MVRGGIIHLCLNVLGKEYTDWVMYGVILRFIVRR